MSSIKVVSSDRSGTPFADTKKSKKETRPVMEFLLLDFESRKDSSVTHLPWQQGYQPAHLAPDSQPPPRLDNSAENFPSLHSDEDPSSSSNDSIDDEFEISRSASGSESERILRRRNWTDGKMTATKSLTRTTLGNDRLL